MFVFDVSVPKIPTVGTPSCVSSKLIMSTHDVWLLTGNRNEVANGNRTPPRIFTMSMLSLLSSEKRGMMYVMMGISSESAGSPGKTYPEL